MTNPTRTINGVELPAPGTWAIDPGHAQVGFVGRHFGLTKVRGRFTGVEGALEIAEDIAGSSVFVDIDMASVNTGDETRDDHLRPSDLMDIAEHPNATFRSTDLQTDGATAILTGDLTIKGVTKSVTLDVEYLGYVKDPWDNQRAVFSAAGNINREGWGLTWNMIIETGGLLVSKEIRIEIEVELIRQESRSARRGQTPNSWQWASLEMTARRLEIRYRHAKRHERPRVEVDAPPQSS